MTGEGQSLSALERQWEDVLAGCEAAFERAGSDDDLLALRDLLLDWQFASRQAITAIEERLGAFEGDDSPRALAAEAETLIEQIEAQQDGWEMRGEQLLAAGFDEARLADFFRQALATRAGTERLGEIFAGIIADMDQTGAFLDYARRYLLSLVVPPPERARPGARPAGGDRRGGNPPRRYDRPRPPRG